MMAQDPTHATNGSMGGSSQQRGGVGHASDEMGGG